MSWHFAAIAAELHEYLAAAGVDLDEGEEEPDAEDERDAAACAELLADPPARD